MRSAGVVTRIFIGTLISGAAALTASAALANTCIGNCGTLGADGDVPAPPGGSTYGYVSTYQGVNGAGEISSVGGTDGSEYLTSTFTAKAGDALDFYFDFTTGDGTSAYPDYAFAELLDGSKSHVAYLFTARTVAGAGNTSPGFGLPADDSTLNPANTPIQAGLTHWSPLGPSSGGCYGGAGNGCGTTGWIQSIYTISTDGTYILRFGATNYGDEAVDTGLAFSGITVGGNPVGTGVPEPAAWALMLAGFGGVGAAMRSARRKAAVA
jgi:hypothetical protein